MTEIAHRIENLDSDRRNPHLIQHQNLTFRVKKKFETILEEICAKNIILGAILTMLASFCFFEILQPEAYGTAATLRSPSRHNLHPRHRTETLPWARQDGLLATKSGCKHARL